MGFISSNSASETALVNSSVLSNLYSHCPMMGDELLLKRSSSKYQWLVMINDIYHAKYNNLKNIFLVTGFHRRLGAQITKARSVLMDEKIWNDSLIGVGAHIFLTYCLYWFSFSNFFVNGFLCLPPSSCKWWVIKMLTFSGNIRCPKTTRSLLMHLGRLLLFALWYFSRSELLSLLLY